jgi:hypothetical protein
LIFDGNHIIKQIQSVTERPATRRIDPIFMAAMDATFSNAARGRIEYANLHTL